MWICIRSLQGLTMLQLKAGGCHPRLGFFLPLTQSEATEHHRAGLFSVWCCPRPPLPPPNFLTGLKRTVL